MQRLSGSVKNTSMEIVFAVLNDVIMEEGYKIAD